MADATYQPKVYRTNGGDKQVVASGGELDVESGGALKLAGTQVTATAAELNAAADVSARTLELTASGVIPAGTQSVELNHASVVIAATYVVQPGLFIIKDTSATGTAAHTVTLTGGTFNGTATIATLNARDE